MYTYSPPACGFIAPSSAYVIAPAIDSAPPTIHARYTNRAEPTACIISAGTRKMPLPIIVPTTIAQAWLTPSSRSRVGALVFVSLTFEYHSRRALSRQQLGL